MKNLICIFATFAALPILSQPAGAKSQHRKAPIDISRTTPGYDPRSPYRFFGYYGPEDAVTLESILFPDRPRRGVILEGSQ